MSRTLVEILAEKLIEWPNGATYALQNKRIESCEYKKVYFYGGATNEEHDFYCDILTVDCGEVTRAQWEAERARIAQKSPVESLPSCSVALAEAKSKEDQALWDRVAMREFTTSRGRLSDSDAAIKAMDAADAFMAERAKRMKQSS